MDDRSDKIITLAREMLRSPPDHPADSMASAKITMSFKILCMATILTASTSSIVTEYVDEARRPINHYEKTELDALVFYVTKLRGVDERVLKRDIESKLGISDFEDLDVSTFKDVRHYLQKQAQR